ncbi:MAG: zinc ABC transporter substrate-binding protein [Zetaproteobacteria bacterium]|nr:MAG: zinc ABC transporter substrate-binding protein [Zetaproteobacteria bacterium]
MFDSSAFQRLLVIVVLILPLSARAADIVVTLPPLAGIVRMLDPASHPACLLPPHADPHHFALTPKLAQQLTQSKLLVRAKPDDAAWSFLNAQPRAFSLWQHARHGWLTPSLVEQALPALAKQLIELHPERKQAIEQRLGKARAVLHGIDQQWQQTLQRWRDDGVVMQHDAWRSLFARHGIPVHAALESTGHGSQATPHLLQEALKVLRGHPNTLLLGDARHNNDELRWLAEQTGHAMVILDPMGSCDEPWPSMMQRNIAQLAGQAH